MTGVLRRYSSPKFFGPTPSASAKNGGAPLAVGIGLKPMASTSHKSPKPIGGVGVYPCVGPINENAHKDCRPKASTRIHENFLINCNILLILLTHQQYAIIA